MSSAFIIWQLTSEYNGDRWGNEIVVFKIASDVRFLFVSVRSHVVPDSSTQDQLIEKPHKSFRSHTELNPPAFIFSQLLPFY